MIDDIVKNDIIVVCQSLDAIKVQDEYVPTPEYDVRRYIELAESLGYKVSHGICPPCLEMYRTQLINLKTLECKFLYDVGGEDE